jgi:hypothetical protein
VIHLYAVTRGTRLPPGLRGLDEAELEIVPCGALDAIVSVHETVPSVDRAAALRHAAVVAAVAEHAAVVPVRFGVEHVDRPNVRRAVRSAETELLRSLERVGGHVEFVVRGARDTRADRPLGTQEPRAEHRTSDALAPGRAYLEDRLAEQRRARRAERVAAAELRALTGPLNEQATVVVERVGPYGPERCYLVELAGLASFTAAASACLHDHEQLVLGGPWPPYTFATEELGS